MKGKIRHFILGGVSSLLTKMMGRKPSSLSVLVISNVLLWALSRGMNRMLKRQSSIWFGRSSLTNLLLPLIGRYQELTEHFSIHFQAIKEYPAEEDIHQLRVTIKKIRIAVRLVGKVSGNSFDAKHYSKIFKSLFRAAGKVREARINAILIQKYSNDQVDSYREYLHDTESAAVSELSEVVDSFDVQKLERLNKVFYQQVNKISPAKIERATNQLVEDHLNAIIKLMHQPHKLHKVRKIIRALSELLKYVNYRLSAGDDPAFFPRMVDQLNTQIGDWHDSLVLVDSLRGFMAESDPPDRNRYEQIIYGIETDIGEMEAEIYEFIDVSLRR